MRVTLADLRRHRYCVSGARAFCERHNLSFKQLKTEGIPVEDFAGIKDAMLDRILGELNERRR